MRAVRAVLMVLRVISALAGEQKFLPTTQIRAAVAERISSGDLSYSHNIVLALAALSYEFRPAKLRQTTNCGKKHNKYFLKKFVKNLRLSKVAVFLNHGRTTSEQLCLI